MNKPRVIDVGVYIHAKPTGEAFYVGKGKRIRARNLKPRNPHHSSIVKKYGKKNIVVDFVPCESEAAAFALEIEWIKTLRLFGAELTNQTDGGEGLLGKSQSKETKLKISLANKGKVRTEEVKAALRAAWIKRRERGVSEETKAKISEASRRMWSDQMQREKILRSRGITK
jgi:hypothetical protein